MARLLALITLPGIESFLVGECKRLRASEAADWLGTVGDGWITVDRPDWDDGAVQTPGTLRAALELVWSGPCEDVPPRLPRAPRLWFEGQIINGRARCEAVRAAIARACGAEAAAEPAAGGPPPDMAAVVDRSGTAVVGRPLRWGLDLARPYRVALMARSLNPAMARAVAMASRARAADVFVDPFCGSGTILAERALLGPCTLIGRDADPGAADAARRTLAALAEHAPGARATVAAADVAIGDARRLDLASGAATAMAANPPFGHRFGDVADNAQLYTHAFAEAARVLRPRARLVVLTADRRHLKQAIRAAGAAFRTRSEARVYLGGLEPTLGVYDRTEAPAP